MLYLKRESNAIAAEFDGGSAAARRATHAGATLPGSRFPRLRNRRADSARRRRAQNDHAVGHNAAAGQSARLRPGDRRHRVPLSTNGKHSIRTPSSRFDRLADLPLSSSRGQRRSIASQSSLAISLLAMRPRRMPIKADERRNVTFATIDPPLKPGSASTLKVDADGRRGLAHQFRQALQRRLHPDQARGRSCPTASRAGAIKYPPAETIALDVRRRRQDFGLRRAISSFGSR